VSSTASSTGGAQQVRVPLARLSPDVMVRLDDGLDTPIIVVRHGGVVYAFDAICTHRRCSLERGDVEDGLVMCPCHGAEFDLKTGAVVEGPATTPLATYGVAVVDEVAVITTSERPGAFGN
jgi:nitrite reductase/ring-hydroxylating ferredoxin subunit